MLLPLPLNINSMRAETVVLFKKTLLSSGSRTVDAHNGSGNAAVYMYVNVRFIVLSGLPTNTFLRVKASLHNAPSRPCPSVCSYSRCAQMQTQGLCTLCFLLLMLFLSSWPPCLRFLLEYCFFASAQPSPRAACPPRTLEFLTPATIGATVGLTYVPLRTVSSVQAGPRPPWAQLCAQHNA